MQSLVHVTLPEAPRSVSWRFGAFFLPFLCLFGLAGVAFAGASSRWRGPGRRQR